MNSEKPLHIRCRYGPSPALSLFLAAIFIFVAWIFMRSALGLRPTDGNYRIDRFLSMFPEDLLPWVAGVFAVGETLLTLWVLSLQVPALTGKSYVEMTEEAITLAYQGKRTTIPFNEVETIEKGIIEINGRFEPGLVIHSNSREPLTIARRLMFDEVKFEILAQAAKRQWQTAKAEKTSAM